MDNDLMKQIHPRPDDHGKRVTLHNPSSPTSITAFSDAEKIAIVVPDGKTPSTLNGVALTAWDSAPEPFTAWVNVTGQTHIDEFQSRLSEQFNAVRT